MNPHRLASPVISELPPTPCLLVSFPTSLRYKLHTIKLTHWNIKLSDFSKFIELYSHYDSSVLEHFLYEIKY
jgi:hypothetical protein